MATLLFEDRAIEARPSDTVAAALLRSGVGIFSRGPKYHRPRGAFCLAGTCGQCQMRVNGEPNVATCMTPAADGMRVERQNVLGSADHDLLRAVDFLFPEGLDHHHLMTKHKVLTAATQAIARRLAGIGQAPTEPFAIRAATQRTERLVIIGAGPAGLAAAAAAIAAGVRPLVIEARGRTGGWATDGFTQDAAATALRLRALEATSVELICNARVVGLYQEGGHPWVVAAAGSGLIQIAAEAVVVATGAIERPIPFEANDLPGIFAGRALLRLMREHAVVPGRRAAVLAHHPDGIVVARGLLEQGIKVLVVAPPDQPLDTGELPILAADLVRAVGRTRVTGLRVRPASGEEKSIRCDLIAVVAPRAPAYELAGETGLSAGLHPASGGFIIDVDGAGATACPWLWAAGSAAGLGVDSLASGERAGHAAASCVTSSGTRR